MYIDSQGETWFKGNLHTHTTCSDGALSPEDTIARYHSQGYDFLALTDHWKTARTFLHANGMLILNGCEYNFGGNVREGIYHIVGIGMKEEPVLSRTASPQEAIDAIHAVGGAVNLAHPSWSMNTLPQLMPLEHVDFTEIYNTTSDLPRNCRPYSGDVLDSLAAHGKFWHLAATDDTHIPPDACRSFIYLKAEELTEESVIKALQSGNFYASQGPRMSVTREGNTLTVRCPEEDGVNAIVAVTDSPWENHRSQMGENLTEATFTFSPAASFMRFEIRDRNNHWAWSDYYAK